jgi:hypothetical protein
MPLRDDLPPDEQDEKPWWKFSECSGCKNRNRKRVCNGCDSGEFFEELDPAGLDGFLHF